MLNKIWTLWLLLWWFIGCSEQKANHNTNNMKQTSTSVDSNKTSQIIQYDLEILDTFKHSVNYYTQGLVIHNDYLYEGTGLEGASKLIKYSLKNLKEEQVISLGRNYFGEGITVFNDKIYQLTWLNQVGFVYDLNTMKLDREFSYVGEGWGITNDDSLIYMSDGSATIRIINFKDFTTKSNIKITSNNNPLRFINELELVDSMLYANVYMQDLIVVSDIKTGKVVGEIDISSLRSQLYNNPTAEVSNGIAYDKSSKTFYLTGKNWNKIFKVKFKKK